MARISRYAFDQEVNGDDFFIGSDARTKKTRNYRINDLTDYLRKQSGLGGTGFAYNFINPDDPKNLQSTKINFDNVEGSSSIYSTVSEIYINRYNVDNQDIYDFLTALFEGKSGIALYTASKLTDFGFYEIDSVNIGDNDVITLTVTPVVSNGIVSISEDIIVTPAFISKKNLGELEDVTFTDTQDKDLLVYDQATEEWINSSDLADITTNSIVNSGNIQTGTIDVDTINANEAQVSSVVVSNDIVANQIEANGSITSATTVTNLILTPRVLSGTMVVPEEHDGILVNTANVDGTIIISEGSTLTITN